MDKDRIGKTTARLNASDGMAQQIEPMATWERLAVSPVTLDGLRDICRQAKDGGTATDRQHTSGKGLVVLFSGPDGTGKAMAAEVIAHELQRDFYRIDLSSVVSRYIGETEKNLSQVFAMAEHRNAVLFFDEADALFGRRTEVRDAHDRYGNVDAAYLFERIEGFEGLVVVATNMKETIDPAFQRRLRAVVEFPLPDASSRETRWRDALPDDPPEGDPKKSGS